MMPNVVEQQLRQQLVNFAIDMNSSGLSAGKSGNLSVRWQHGFLITPSAVAYEDLDAEDIVFVEDYEGNSRSRLQPSSEWRFHAGIFQARNDAHAVVHTHSTFCTALACAGRSIPAFHYMVAIAGGDDIPLADYALYGTEALSHNILQAITQRNACLIANHGMVAIGKDLSSAFNLAVEVENLARQYSETLKLGEPRLLSGPQMAEVLAKFKTYGQRT